MVARRISTTTLVDPESPTSFRASCLIALNKCPSVRPIGVGEVVRRIIGKAILYVIGQNIRDAAGPLQLCAGQMAGSEDAVHAMQTIFKKDEMEAVLEVDAINAFNCLNRQSALHNI